MSMVMMHRRCIHCGEKYTYNPSVGKFGLICPRCGKINPFVPRIQKSIKLHSPKQNNK